MAVVAKTFQLSVSGESQNTVRGGSKKQGTVADGSAHCYQARNRRVPGSITAKVRRCSFLQGIALCDKTRQTGASTNKTSAEPHVADILQQRRSTQPFVSLDRDERHYDVSFAVSPPAM